MGSIRFAFRITGASLKRVAPSPDTEEMRQKVLGVVALLFGGAILLYGLVTVVPSPSRVEETGFGGFAIGGFLVVAGVMLVKGIR
jgi:hypothetical protein